MMAVKLVTIEDKYRSKVHMANTMARRPSTVGMEVCSFITPTLSLNPWQTCGISETTKLMLAAVITASCQIICLGLVRDFDDIPWACGSGFLICCNIHFKDFSNGETVVLDF